MLLGALAALVIAGGLVTPVVLRSGGTKTCTRTLLYKGRRYVARQIPANQVVEAIAIGVGVVRGCGETPANVDLRSLTGVRPLEAVGVTGDESSIYVRAGVCRATSAQLVACLQRD